MARQLRCLFVLFLSLAGCESGGNPAASAPIAAQPVSQAPGPPGPPGAPADSASTPGAADSASKLPPPSKEAMAGSTLREGLVEPSYPTAEKWNADASTSLYKQKQDTGKWIDLPAVLEVTGELKELLPAHRAGSADGNYSFEGVYAMVKVEYLTEPVKCHFLIVSSDHKLTRLVGQKIVVRGATYMGCFDPGSLPLTGWLSLTQCQLISPP